MRGHSPRLELVREDPPVRGVVVDDERPSPAEAALLGPQERRHRALAGPHDHGEAERAPAPRHALALDPHGAAHELAEPAADGEAEARAAEAPRRRAVDLAERLEEPALPLLGNTHAGVAHGEFEAEPPVVRRPVGAHAHHDLAAIGELHRVADEVQEDLPEPRVVADDRRRHVRRDLAGHVEALLRGGGAQQHERPLDALAEVEGARVDVHAARLDLREIEDVVDDREERVAARADGARELALHRREVRVEEQARHADDGVHRRAHLVAHRREERALRRVRLLRGELRALARLAKRVGAGRHVPRLAIEPLLPAEDHEQQERVEGHLEPQHHLADHGADVRRNRPQEPRVEARSEADVGDERGDADGRDDPEPPRADDHAREQQHEHVARGHLHQRLGKDQRDAAEVRDERGDEERSGEGAATAPEQPPAEHDHRRVGREDARVHHELDVLRREAPERRRDHRAGDQAVREVPRQIHREQLAPAGLADVQCELVRGGAFGDPVFVGLRVHAAVAFARHRMPSPRGCRCDPSVARRRPRRRKVCGEWRVCDLSGRLPIRSALSGGLRRRASRRVGLSPPATACDRASAGPPGCQPRERRGRVRPAPSRSGCPKGR